MRRIVVPAKAGTMIFWLPQPSFDQRAAALLLRTEGFFGRDGGEDVVVVPRSLGLGRLLYLDEISVVDLAAVGADAALAEERVLRRHLLHLGDHLGGVVALQRLDCLDPRRLSRRGKE